MVVVGIDEAGRGALVGNVVAAAVVLVKGFYLPGLTDSKKINPNKRELLFNIISKTCQYSIGIANAKEIDRLNILQATMLAMKRAVDNLGVKYDNALVDGDRCPDIKNCTAIIKGDLSEPVISAASIIAKVSRDRQMLELDKLYPQYSFREHKGYGTVKHMHALAKYGVISGQHRLSFAPVSKNR